MTTYISGDIRRDPMPPEVSAELKQLCGGVALSSTDVHLLKIFEGEEQVAGEMYVYTNATTREGTVRRTLVDSEENPLKISDRTRAWLGAIGDCNWEDPQQPKWREPASVYFAGRTKK